MSAWPGKFVIGLTGNIATGKSVIRKMLEHLGAYGIDADALGHRAISKDAPGYQPVLNTFGRYILAPDEQIDRNKLARIVFSDPDALARLEAIVHPLVAQAIDVLVRRSHHKVIVIEAIKLLESGLRAKCDVVWVAHTPEKVQITRLVQKRGQSESAARLRINAQPSQEMKVAIADVVIQNDGSFDLAWRQVLEAWQRQFPAEAGAEEAETLGITGKLAVRRATPSQAGEIAEFINQHSRDSRMMSREDIMAAFGEKAFLLLALDRKLVGLASWQVENLVVRTIDIYLEADLPAREALRALTEEIERASRELQCEIALIYLGPELARRQDVWRSLGYQPRTVQSLGVRAWQEAAAESMPAGTKMYFKQLRRDRVLRPV
jgi:dephospho-CoA kinase